MSLQTRLESLVSSIGADIKALRIAQVKSYSQTLSTSATSYTITHNLGTRDVEVQVYEASNNYERIWVTDRRPTINTVTLMFTTAPTVNQYRVVIQGKAD